MEKRSCRYCVHSQPCYSWWVSLGNEESVDAMNDKKFKDCGYFNPTWLNCFSHIEQDAKLKKIWEDYYKRDKM